MSTIIGRTISNNKRTTLTIIAGAAALAIVSLIIFLTVSRGLSNTREFCRTEDCVRHTTLLTQYLDSTRDPCNNFRDYVCSAWHSSSDYSEQVTSVMDSLRYSWYKDFKDILMQGSLKIPAGRKPLAMYDMCISGYKSGASQLTPFLEFLKRGELTWPEPPRVLFEPLSLAVYLAYRWQSPFWISVSVLEPTSSGKRRILVSPGLYLPIARKQHRNARLTYVKYWELFLVHLYPDATTRPPINVTDVENVRDVERDISESIYSVISSGKMQPALFPFGELRKHVPIASDYLVVSDMALIRTLAELLVKYTARQLNRHLIWLMVQYYSPLAGYEFLKIYYGSERKAAKYLLAYCAHRVEVSYKALVLALGFYSLFTAQDIRTIDTGFDTLVTEAVKKIDSCKWMDKESKVRATRKLTAVKKALWPPAPVLDKDELERVYAKFPEKADTFFRYWALASIAAVRAKWTREYLEAFRLRWNNLPDYVGYDYVLNSVELAIAVATPPAYYRNGTKAMLYGGLLFLMAMQLVRAIDTEGVRWTPDGTAIDTILTESTHTTYLEKASCNIGAGNRSVFPEIPALDITYSALMTSHLLEETEALPLSQDLPADKVFFMTAVAKQLFSTRKFCVTEDCVRHTTLLTKYLDPNRDPCENFSAYVCSAWYTSSDHSEQVTSVLDSLRFSWYQHFRDILLQGALKIPAGEKPLAMYDMCSTGYKSGASQRASFLEFLKSHKLTWPEPPAQLHEPLGLIIYLAYKWQSPSWVSVRVLEPAPSGQQRILVSPGLYMPIVRKQHQNIKLTYVKYWELFLVHLYPDATARPRINVTDVENVRDVEGDILEAIDSVMRSAKMQPALFLFSEISHHVPSASASVWVDGFQRGLSLEPKLTSQDYLAVSDLSLIITVAELLAKYNVRQLNIHMIWLLVQYHSLFAGYEFLKIHYGSERKAMTYLPAYCAHRVEVSYKVLVVALGFHSLFTEQDRSTIDIGFDSLVTAAVKKINSAEWMDKESKVRVSTKLAAVKKALWPPAAVLDRDELERIYANFPGKAESFFEYWILASTAAAKYKKTREYLEAFRLRWNNLPDYIGYNYVVNSVELAIAAATPPSYYRNGTKAMLYGGLLFLMATQLVRAIDAEGLKWTSNGTVVNSILTDSTYAKFQAKASCNNGMENSSVFPEIPALDITYSALKNSYLLDEREPLPLREDLPAEKVFFMTVCYLTCANPSGHYPFAADCNKLVQNSKSFARVFNCPKGSKMNPVEKCSFFT
ncbi:hypothetical protein V5799_007567 [Amblyomma americanum]|uniref:M13 family peptidase n=1 Tax=Amblyomma americanum TaxID=6943 RepID=A0AAQ4FHK3_AMBAM